MSVANNTPTVSGGGQEDGHTPTFEVGRKV